MKYREPEERIPRINRVKEGWGEGGCAGDGRDRPRQTKMGSGSDGNTQRPPFFINFNIYPVKSSHLNFHPLEVVSRWREPQLQAGENYSYLFNLRPKI